MQKLIERMSSMVKFIRKIITFTVTLNNILGTKKYSKETKVPKDEICVLGISKL